MNWNCLSNIPRENLLFRSFLSAADAALFCLWGKISIFFHWINSFIKFLTSCWDNQFIYCWHKTEDKLSWLVYLHSKVWWRRLTVQHHEACWIFFYTFFHLFFLWFFLMFKCLCMRISALLFSILAPFPFILYFWIFIDFN
jgi:hypothetical protein